MMLARLSAAILRAPGRAAELVDQRMAQFVVQDETVCRGRRGRPCAPASTDWRGRKGEANQNGDDQRYQAAEAAPHPHHLRTSQWARCPKSAQKYYGEIRIY